MLHQSLTSRRLHLNDPCPVRSVVSLHLYDFGRMCLGQAASKHREVLTEHKHEPAGRVGGGSREPWTAQGRWDDAG